MDTANETFEQALIGSGNPRRMDGHTLHALDDPGRALYVLEGGVDLFAFPGDADGEGAMRRHLFTMEPGGLLFGLPEGLGGVRVIAQARIDTRLVEIPASDIRALADGTKFHAELAAALDPWIVGLGNGVVRHVFPKPVSRFSPKPEMEQAVPEGEVVKVRRGTLWLELPEAVAMFDDIEPVPLPGPVLFPLGGDSWLKVHEAFRLKAMDTASALAGGGCWNGLDALHEAVMNCLPINISLAEVDEVNRLNTRTRRQETNLEEMNADFADLIGSKKTAGSAVRSGEHLFIAASAVIKSIGGTPRYPLKVTQADADVPPTVDEIAHASGLRHREIKLDELWWKKDGGPLLGFRKDDGRPVALLPRPHGGYRLIDPEDGRDTVVDRQTGQGIGSTAYVFYESLPDKKLSLRKMIFFGLRQTRWDMGSTLAAGLLSALIGMAVPIATGAVFNTIIPGHLPNLLYQVGLALLVLAVANSLFAIAADVGISRIQSRAEVRFKAALWDRVLRFPLSFLREQASGTLAARMESLEEYLHLVRGTIQALSSSLGMLVASLAVLAWYDWRAALVVVPLILLLFAATAVFAALQYKAFSGGGRAMGLVDSLVLEAITGVAKIRMAAAEDRVLVNWGRRFGILRSKQVALLRVFNAQQAFSAGYSVLMLAGVFAVVALLNKDPVTTGTFLAFITAYGNAIAAAQLLTGSVLTLFQQAPLTPFFKPLLETVPHSNATKANPGDLTGHIDVNDLSFRYAASSPRVLDGLSFSVEPGEFLAIVGASGGGKSTLVRLILGLETPQNGSIFFDGKDLRGLDHDAVRRQIGTVLQQVKLMPGSLYENIRGASDCTQDEAWEAARMAGIAEDIEAMPMRMGTIVTDASRLLSGGQIQRIAIARALVRHPPILIFDEATSSLDNRTQMSIAQQLEGLSTTRLVIAHNLSTIRNADRIIVLDAGQLAEQGSYRDLMEKKGVFYDLAKRQIA